MERLKKHVDSMFTKYKEDKQIKELKYEVLSNLEAKAEDLIAGGMEYSEAIETAKKSIDNIDYLIDGNKEVYINKYKLEYLQVIFLYFLIVWIITMPLAILSGGILINLIMLVSIVVIGGKYFTSRKKLSGSFNLKSRINLNWQLKIRKIAWGLWILFITVYILFITALQFGSNIWFSRPISIDGPYQLARMLIKYSIPFISVIIPLCFNLAPKLILKYEVGEENES
jgi:hypothetical protein